MTRITITPQEKQSRKLSQESLRVAVDAIHRDGYVILDDAIELAHVNALRDKMAEDLKVIIEKRGKDYNAGHGHYQHNPPPMAPYLFRDVLMNEFAVAVTKAILGAGLYNGFYSGNTNMPGSAYQETHADMDPLFPEIDVALPPWALVVNVPVVDMSAANGSVECWPGTHAIVRQSSVGKALSVLSEDVLAKRREVSPPIQPEVKRGGILIRDIRLWHRGVPNPSDKPRTMIAMIHYRKWCRGMQSKFPRETRDFFKDSELGNNFIFLDGPVDYLSVGIQQPKRSLARRVASKIKRMVSA